LLPEIGWMNIQNLPASIWALDIAGAVATSAQLRLSTGNGTFPYCWEAWLSKERWLR